MTRSTLDTVRLGMTRLDVSPIAFGAWQLGGEWGQFDADEAVAAIRHARGLGVNLFDTAQGYGFGASEQVLGQALRDDLDSRRDEVVLATKGGLRMTDDGLVRDSSPEWLRTGVDDSLRALGVDQIDLYQVHWPDPAVPFAETAGALEELVQEGKISHVGVSNFDAEQMEAFSTVRPVETLQPPYHLFRRGIEGEVLPYCVEHNIGVLVYSPLGSGLLTGRMTGDTTFEEDDWRSRASAYTGAKLEQNLAVVAKLAEFAQQRGLHISQLAIAWALAKPGVDVAIVGARSRVNIERSLAAADVELSDDDLAEIERIAAQGVQVEGASPEGVV